MRPSCFHSLFLVIAVLTLSPRLCVGKTLKASLADVLRLKISPEVEASCKLTITPSPPRTPPDLAREVLISSTGHSLRINDPETKLKWTYPYRNNEGFARVRLLGSGIEPSFDLLVDHATGTVIGLSIRMLMGLTKDGAPEFIHKICGQSPYGAFPDLIDQKPCTGC
jgi:hypothetical protein